MDISKEETSSYEENKRFLSHSYTTRKEFVSKYRKLYYGKIKAKELYLQILTELDRLILLNNVGSFKNLTILISYISSVESQATLRTYYENTNNPIFNTNIVILTCKYNKDEILKYIFSNSEILNNLSINNGKVEILPDDEDDTGHNAFYYAIRSGNVELLDTLINKWPGNYFDNNSVELDELLSKAYEELKLKHVSLSNEMEIFVQNTLINLRFFFNDTGNIQSGKASFSKVKQRIELVLQNINVLLNLNTEIEERFLYTSKFVAQNIHILKRQLKPTYDRLPWEEIEFCLISFVSSYIKKQEINLFYHATLTKEKILKHLENFANRLEEMKENMDISKSNNLPKLKREKVITEIVNNYPEFEELYKDYQQIRDIHSLEKISNYVKFALSSDPNKKEGQLIITRTLQVLGECLKNTLESPNLSTTTSELLLLSLPKNTRQVVIDLRNSISHAYSLFKRTEIQQNASISFFTGIQNDTKKIDSVITDIRTNFKIKTIKKLLNIIINSENLDEIKEVAEAFNNTAVDIISSENFAMMEHQKLEKLIKKLSSIVTEKTSYEEELFNKIYKAISFERSKFGNITNEKIRNKTSVSLKLANIANDPYMLGFMSLKCLCYGLHDLKIDNNIFRGIKFRANQTLHNMPPKIEPHCFKKIAYLSSKILHSIRSRLQHDCLDETNMIICEIFHIVEFEVGNIKWLEELREKLNENGSFIPECKQKKTYSVTKQKYNNHLALKLSELKSILKNSVINNELTSYRNDRKLQIMLEMLVLDIMSVLDMSKEYLTNNLLFVDDNAPLLIGRCLRNHLAHGNALVDISLFDPLIALILNAKKLTADNIVEIKKKIGKFVSDDPLKLKNKYDQDLVTIINKRNMFVSLEKGNLEDLKTCLKNGADIHARSINLWTTLHFAAKGPSLEVVKFILDQNVSVNVKDTNGQSPLHIAAACGRRNIVELFIEEQGLLVGQMDNYGETPLHIAARNGHKDTVQVLLKNKANNITKNMSGLSPLHYAIRNNHIDVVKVLLEEDANVDINESMGGFTPLHEAAERGYMELVNFLIQNQANVNAKNDKDWTPLHAAALNGHVEVVTTLILKGADVNARVLDGCTPLHYAVENSHEKIVHILVKQGVNVNVADKTYNNTPLHYAAKNGHEGIVNSLLTNKANASIATVDGLTPLHFAAENGHVNIVNYLLKYGVDINVGNIATPLHCAVARGQIEIADLLIKNKAKVNAKDENDLTALHVAALNGHKGIIDILIQNKAEINIKANNNLAPLHAAATKGDRNVIDVLIKNHAEVNARTIDGLTPLHFAALGGHTDAVIVLLNNKAKINAKANCNFTPLHYAVLKSHKNVVNLLVKNNAHVNATDIADNTPLNLAVEIGNKEITELLIENDANINANNKWNLTPLLSAVKYNHKEIVQVLIANGADVNVDDSKPLLLAVFGGYKDIVEILLKNKASVNIKCTEIDNLTLLHLAARTGRKGIVNALISKGADVNATTYLHNITPLCIATEEGHEEIVEVLILNGANINAGNIEGTPLHIAACRGHDNIVQVLLNNGADIYVKDIKNRTSAEQAVAYNRMQVVRTLLEHKKVDINAKGNDDWTMLHIAAQEGNLDITRYLVEQGANINARNSSGSKPIHIAAREGYKNIVEFFLMKGLSINDLGAASQTLLHYTAIGAQLGVAEYLIDQGADVNIKDANGSTPIHIAARFGSRDIIEVLLKNKAIYNAVNNFYKKPLEMANDKNIIDLLVSTEKLFEAVKHNNSLEVKKHIKAGAFVNAKNVNSGTPLHYAAWKGYNKIIDILLQNKCNPNVVGNKGFTPLHYAAKFSHLQVVKALLTNGAIYNAVSDTGKTPIDFAVDKSIENLFKLVSESFKNIKNGNSKVINDLKNIKDIDTAKAVMNACNKENKTLVVAAIHNDFPRVEELKQMFQDDVSGYTKMVDVLLAQEKYQEALNILRKVLEKRKEILGPDNPGTLDIHREIAKILYKKQNYQESLIMLREIYQKQKELLGLDNQDALYTRSFIAIVLHRLAKNHEALNIYEEVYQKQKEILGVNHVDVINTQISMALVLDRLEKYEEALKVNYKVFEKCKELFGLCHPITLVTQNNIAMVLNNQGKHDEALKIYKKVYEGRKRIIGPVHSDTLRTLHNIVGVLYLQQKYDEALKTYKEVFETQKVVLGPSHLDTLNTQFNMANLLFSQGKFIGAFKNYMESIEQRKNILGPNHPGILITQQNIDIINFRLKLDGSNTSEILQHLQTDINIASYNGDIPTVQRLLKDGVDVNDKDVDGRTPLHYAISNSQIGVVTILLKNGADVTQVTNKGNTTLHTATSKGYKEIVEILVKHIERNKLNDFINAQTIGGGATAIHVAAKNGYLEIVKLLLNYGAIFNIENKERKTPLVLCKDQHISNLFKLTEDLFDDAETGNVEIISKLSSIQPDEFVAVTNARNNHGSTLLQVSITNKHKYIVCQLLEMFKKSDETLEINTKGKVRSLKL